MDYHSAGNFSRYNCMGWTMHVVWSTNYLGKFQILEEKILTFLGNNDSSVSWIYFCNWQKDPLQY